MVQVFTLLSILKDATEDSIQSVANSIVEHCRQLAADPEYMSPFARNAVANGFGADITGKLFTVFV